MIPDLSLFLAGIVLAAAQFVAALPWLWAIDTKGFKDALATPLTLVYVGIGLLVAGFGVASYLSYKGEAANLVWDGRYIYGAVLHLQLIIDLFFLLPRGLTLVWPKGGAVASAAFRESCRQPMFWLITVGSAALIWFSVIWPYFTFGDDYKMMKQIGFDVVMLAAVLFGTLAASISISEEIEGRTAVTLLSKPVSRRQFLLGKYLGIVLAGLFMFGMLAVWFEGVLLVKHWFERLSDLSSVTESSVQESQRIGVVATPLWILQTLKQWDLPGQITDILRGMGQWGAHTWDTLPGLALYFCQVMVLV